MASNIVEFFGYAPLDESKIASRTRADLRCPFIQSTCVKTLNDGLISGVCTLQPMTTGPVICCPIRLYAEDYRILSDVAETVFGPGIPMLPPAKAKRSSTECIAVFGKRWGGELHLPSRGTGGAYFVDWILAHRSASGKLLEFVAVEVQSIDTTGNYRGEREAYLAGVEFDGASSAGFNWENVNKRILPQLIYKGHVLRQEPLCKKGLFFVCPTPVYDKVTERLGGTLRPYPIQPGALTFSWYDVGPRLSEGQIRKLVQRGMLTTTVDQVALAFTAPSNLPPARVYEEAIRAVLR